MKRIPDLQCRENEHLADILMELGLEMKGLNYLTKQNLSKDVKSLDVKS
jgi:hypothetical protein